MSKEKEKIREPVRVAALLQAALSAVDKGKLHYRKLEAAKIQGLDGEKGKFG